RYLIDALATQIWAASPGALQVFEGTYSEYVAEREKQKDAAPAAAPRSQASQPQPDSSDTGRKKHGLNPFQLERRVAEVETAIHTLEARLEQLNAEISTAGANGEVE